jgi:hypothetical protein
VAATARNLAIAGSTVALLLIGSSATAQLADRLSAYTGRNAAGYLGPLVNAFGADLNAGLFYTGHVPRKGFHMTLELRAMSVYFTDSDRTFMATTEHGFSPETVTEAPTIVGPTRAVIIRGDDFTSFAFPGGFDLQSFSFAVPQLRVGSVFGTEAIVRFLLYGSGNRQLGDLDLYGFGVRHSVSQYLNRLPMEAAVSIFWQRFSMGASENGGDVIEAISGSVGLHVSKRYAWAEPFVGLSYDRFEMDVTYESDSGSSTDDISIVFDPAYTTRMTFGMAAYFSFMNVQGEYNVSDRNAFSVGLGFRLFGN